MFFSVHGACVLVDAPWIYEGKVKRLIKQFIKLYEAYLNKRETLHQVASEFLYDYSE